MNSRWVSAVAEWIAPRVLENPVLIAPPDSRVATPRAVPRLMSFRRLVSVVSLLGTLAFDRVMEKVEAVERQIEQFSSEELVAFRRWFAEFDARLWDEQFERDVAAGKLDKLADEALAELREGKCTDL